MTEDTDATSGGFKIYDGFVRTSFADDGKRATIEFETEDEYQSIDIYAETEYPESNFADYTPFVRDNSLACSYTTESNHGAGLTGCGRNVFTFELQDACWRVRNLLDGNGSYTTCFFKALGKEMFIRKLSDDSYRFTIVDNGDECPLATQQIISSDELRQIGDFFARCARLFPVVGRPSPYERIVSSCPCTAEALERLRDQLGLPPESQEEDWETDEEAWQPARRPKRRY